MTTKTRGWSSSQKCVDCSIIAFRFGRGILLSAISVCDVVAPSHPLYCPSIRCIFAGQEEHAHNRALADKEAFLNDQIRSNKVSCLGRASVMH